MHVCVCVCLCMPVLGMPLNHFIIDRQQILRIELPYSKTQKPKIDINYQAHNLHIGMKTGICKDPPQFAERFILIDALSIK